jgi:hypothetical protein
MLKMNGPSWITWTLFVILAILSIVLLVGKGSFLIAGFNTSSKETKSKYNEKRLCRVIGGGFAVITLIMGTSLYYEFEYPIAILELMIPWGILIVIALMLILGNTVCRKK